MKTARDFFVVVFYYGILALFAILVITPINLWEHLQKIRSSLDRKITMDLWCHHLGIILALIFFHFHKGFDDQELFLSLCVPTLPFLLLSYLFFTGRLLTKPENLKPEYKWMKIYFWVVVGVITFKAIGGILSFPWMLLIFSVVELFFSTYLLILYMGIQKVNSDFDI